MDIPDIDTRKISIDELKKIKYYIEHCQERSEWIEILKIIKNNFIKYTENSNGSFLNLSIMNNKALNDIIDFTSNLLAHKDCNLLENSANNVSSYEIYSMKSLQSSIFEEYKNDICKNYINCNDYENNDEPSIGGKINLKRYKKKYIGSKAKILKLYRDISRSSAICRSIKITSQRLSKKIPIKKVLKKNKECIDKFEGDTLNKTMDDNDEDDDDDDDDDDDNDDNDDDDE